jgi:hypothetical protein
MANLHLLPKSIYGEHDMQRAVLRSMAMAKGLRQPIPVVFGKKAVACVGWDQHTDEVWAAPFESWDDIIREITQSTPQTFSTLIKKSHLAFTETTGLWYDYWPVAAGDPDGGTYPGAAATAYVGSPTADPGFPSVGPALTGSQTRHLMSAELCPQTQSGGTNPIVTVIIYDRVLVYSACAIVNALTNMTNSVPATRYSGVGVQIMVTSQVVLGGAVNLTALSYKNELGNTQSATGLSRALDVGTTASATTPAQVNGGTPRTPWLGLAAGDNGVQIINSWTCSAAQTGSLCFVLANPIYMFSFPVLRQNLTHDLLRGNCNMFKIADDACLSVITQTNGAQSNLTVSLQMAWG